MIISGIAKSSLLDYPGLLSGVLFLPGCNYDCFYCHNRSLIDGSHSFLNPREVETFLQKRKGKLDAVVISGGEPTLHKDLIALIAQIRLLGYKIKLDTNGSNPQVIAELLAKNLCHYYAVDYKAPLSRYEEICGKGADGKKTLETIGLLLESGVDFQVRTTVIPQLSKVDLLIMAKELPLLPSYVLNAYRKPPSFLPEDRQRIEQPPYSQADIKALTKEIAVYQPNAIC